jgi:uncharacterized protein YjaG (DUF416 family)
MLIAEGVMNNLFVKIRRKILGAGYIFDENRIKGSLTKLPIKLRILFAVTCAERLFPAYERFSAKTGGGNVDLLRRILDKLWMGLLGVQEYSDQIIAADLQHCMLLVPKESDGEWFNEQVWAEDAVACLAYCLRTRLSGDTQEAAWAARRVYEAADYYVLHASGNNYKLPDDESRVIEHPLVQAELRRQERDISELLSLVPSQENIMTAVNGFKLRSQVEHVIPD